MVEMTSSKYNVQSGFCGIQGIKRSLAVAPDTSHARTYPILFLSSDVSVTLQRINSRRRSVVVL